MFTDESGRVPYVKDVFDLAWGGSRLGDILVYTNSDICVRSDCSLLIAYVMQDLQACYSYRRDFYDDFHSPLPDQKIHTGADYAGCDLFAFRSEWWTLHRHDFPDLLLGRESWDAVLRTMIDWTHQSNAGALIDLIYHRKHSSNWEAPSNRLRIKGQLYCRKLVRQWCASKGIESLVAA